MFCKPDGHTVFSVSIQWEAIADSWFVADHITGEAGTAQLAAKMGEMDSEVMGLLR